MIDSVLESLNEPSLAVAVAAYTPASENPGAKWMFPLVASVVLTVMNVGPAPFVNERGFPSASEAVIT